MQQDFQRGVTWRAIAIAVLLSPLECFWLIHIEIVRGAGFSTTVSLFFTVVLTLLVLNLLNLPLRYFLPRWALSRGEMLTIYAMLSIVTSLCAIDSMEALLCLIPYAFRNATPENHWKFLFHRHVPDWLVVRDPRILKGFYEGQSSFWQPHVFRAWMPAILWWSAFATVLLATMLCLCAILRRRWTDHDRLTYPIAQVPFEIADPAWSLWKSKTFWIGFGLAGFYDLLNGLHSVWPAIPGINMATQWNATQWTLSAPWNAIGWMPISFFPFVIGLGFLMPTELLFSVWFFFVVWKLENVLAAGFGWEVGRHKWPYMEEQSLGTYLAVTAFVLYVGRHHFQEVLRSAFGQRRAGDDGGRGEPLPFSFAFWGSVVGFGLLVAFSCVAGLRPWVGVAFFLMYFAIAVSITRLRAQLGPTTHDLHFIGPDQTLVASFGSRAFDARSLTVMTYFYWFNRAYRNHPMPHILESFKYGRQAGLNLRHLSMALVLAAAVGALSVFGAYLHIAYTLGASAKMTGWGTYGYSVEAFNRLAHSLDVGDPPNVGGTVATTVGFALAWGLMSLQGQFPWLTLHPLGYALSGGWSGHWTYSSLFVAWVLKSLIARYGGREALTQARPVFLGFVMGEFVVGGLWSLIGVLYRLPTYAFWPG